MRSHHLSLIAGGVVWFLTLSGMPDLLLAQQQLDCREQECSAAQLRQALFPLKPRGLQPVDPAPPPAPIINVLFETNSDVIRTDYYGELDKLGEVLTTPGYEETRIEIDGHTDDRGVDMYNDDLSLRRASSVKQYLVDTFRIQPQRIEVKGYGETLPTVSNATVEGRRKNRRVEVKALD